MAIPAQDIDATWNHIFHCRQYLDNVLEALDKNEPGKAGELLWGGVAQAVRAEVSWRGPVIETHRDSMNFAYSLEREIGDSSFRFVLRSARSLHHNFYVPVDTLEEVERLLPGIQTAINHILSLLHEEVRDATSTV